MIALINALSTGNSALILLNIPSTAKKVRLLRNTTGVFANQNDQLLIYEGIERLITDTAALDNGVEVFYQPFYFDGVLWSTAPAKSITPGIMLYNRSVDVLSLVRDRLDLGLNSLLQRGDLAHQNGIIPVFTASPQFEDTVFPVVTVHLTGDSDDTRFMGDQIVPDIRNDNFTVTENSGWLSSVTIEVVVWSLNGDERKLFRSAIKSILIGNLQIFRANEMEEIHLSFSDAEDFMTYNTPMYMGNATLTCLAPTAIVNDAPAIKTVESIPHPVF